MGCGKVERMWEGGTNVGRRSGCGKVERMVERKDNLLICFGLGSSDALMEVLGHSMQRKLQRYFQGAF
jgi:hypothetical protein